MGKPVALWSTPRSVSTAFDKMMRSRGDHRVFTEPFSVPYYYGPDRRSDRYAPVQGEPGVPVATYRQVWTELLAAAEAGPVFVKEMPHHLGGGLEPHALACFASSFLIRDPAWSVPSCLAMWPDATDEELGYGAQRRAFELVREADGEPPVIDAQDLRAEPARVVAGWCERTGVPFRAETLEWEPGMPEDWALWADWFGRAATSTTFLPPEEREPPPVTPDVAKRIDRCREHYAELHRHRIC